MMDCHVAWEICFASSFSVCVDLLIFFFSAEMLLLGAFDLPVKFKS